MKTNGSILSQLASPSQGSYDLWVILHIQLIIVVSVIVLSLGSISIVGEGLNGCLYNSEQFQTCL